ncbi:MAG: WD40 repeat domain-containing serine/threonine protein kinase [Aureliella sp.]
MGVVFLAEQTKPVERRVALKIIKPGMDTQHVIARFEAERQALAIMDHPNIAKVFDAGATETGRPFFVMELVNGVPITQFCDQQHLTARERLELFIPVCQAVQHAHQKGIIHRDLKPSNILVALYDGKPTPKIIDFGVAKATSHRLSGRTLFTAIGQIVGTVEYMSPEQASRNPLDVDTRSDVYSLGVVLYELLTGDTPFDKQRLRDVAWDEILRIIREEEPPRPSTKLSSSCNLASIAANRRTEPAKLSALVRGELDWIVIKALEKDRSRRYESASQFAEDIGHFLDNEPVIACPPSSSYRCRKLVRRNWQAASVSLLLLLTLLVGLAGTIWQARRARDSELKATHALDDEKRARQQESVQRERAEESRRIMLDALNESERRRSRIYLERGLQNIDVDPHSGMPWLLEALKTEPIDSPTRATHRLRMALMVNETPRPLGFWREASRAQFSSDGEKVAVATGKQVHLIKLPDLRMIRTLDHEEPVAGIEFTPQGDRLATISGTPGASRHLRMWNSATGAALSPPIDLAENEYGMREVPTVHFTPDGTRFVAVYAGMYNRWHSKFVTRVYDCRTFEQISKTFAHHSDLDLLSGYQQLSPDRMRVLVSRGAAASDASVDWVDPTFHEQNHRPQQYDLMTGQQVHPPLDEELGFYDVPLYSPDGNAFATVMEGTVKLWDASSGQLIRKFALSSSQSHARLQFHPDGKSLFGIEEGVAYCWDLETGRVKFEWRHKDKFYLDPSGRHIVYLDPSGAHYIDDFLNNGTGPRPIPEFYSVQFCQDGSRFVLTPPVHTEAGMSISAPRRIFDSATGRAITPPWRFEGGPKVDPALSHDGRFYLASDDAGVFLWDLESRHDTVAKFPPGRTQQVVDMTVSHDRRTLALLTSDHQITCWDTETGQLRYRPVEIPTPSTGSNHGRWHSLRLNDAADAVVLVGEYDVTEGDASRQVEVIAVWNLQTGKPAFSPLKLDQASSGRIRSAQFVAAGSELLVVEFLPGTGAADQSTSRAITRVHSLSVTTGERVRAAREFSGSLQVLDVRSSGQRLVVLHASESPTFAGMTDPKTEAVQILDYPSWRATSSLITPERGIAWNAKLSPDGGLLAIGDGEVWDPAEGKQSVPAILGHRSVLEIVFRDDGQAFLAITAGGDGLWEKPAEMFLFSRDGKALIPPLTSSRTGAPHCAIHPSGGVIAAAGGSLRLWDAQEATPLNRILELNADRNVGPEEGGDPSIFFTPTGNRLYLHAGSEVFVVHWSEETRSVPSDAVLAAWSELLSGYRLDDHGALTPLTPLDCQSAWETIQAQTEPTLASGML